MTECQSFSHKKETDSRSSDCYSVERTCCPSQRGTVCVDFMRAWDNDTAVLLSFFWRVEVAEVDATRWRRVTSTDVIVLIWSSTADGEGPQ